MKLKFIAICTLLSIASSSFAVRVKMPNAEILNKRLRENGFGFFAEKTKIVKQLADEEFEAIEIALKIETAVYDYNQYMKMPMSAKQMEMSKPDLFETLLQDSPEALEELQKQKLYKPTE